MPPPIIISVAFSSRFSRISILSETFAPPIMATKGFSASCNTFSALFTSASISRPNIFLSSGKNFAITAVEACARCAVPKASFTYTSPSAPVFLQILHHLFLLPYKNEDFPAAILLPASACWQSSWPVHRYNHLANKNSYTTQQF